MEGDEDTPMPPSEIGDDTGDRRLPPHSPGGDEPVDSAVEVAALRETLASRSRTFADISHELKTPLSISLALLDRMLAADELSPGQRHDAEAVRRHTQTLLAQVSELLSAARLEAGQMVLHLRACDLAVLVWRVVEDFTPLAHSRNVRLVCDSPPGLVVRVDPERLAGALANLVSNALRFTPAGGVVRTTVRAEQGAVHLEVADSGPGIPEQLRSAVFERYHQSDGLSARALGSSGLGLTLVRELIRLHGGQVSAGRAPEGGALISLVLPASAGALHSGQTGLGQDVEELLALSAVRLGSELRAELAAGAGTSSAPEPAEAEDYVAAFEQSPVAMGTLDLRGRWMRANPALCAMLGLSETQLRGRDLDSVTHPADVGAEREHLRKVLDGEIRGVQLERRIASASGEWIRALVSLGVARSPDGTPTRLLLHVDEVRRRRRPLRITPPSAPWR
jgi:PAS domain S-box-containing protein